MRILRSLPIFAVVLLMTACVPSLYPLYTERDQVFDPGFVGVWVAVDDGHETIWTVTKSGEGYEMVDVEEDEGETDGPGRFAALALDDLHKDNVSGGDPYGVRLPNPAADFPFLYERHNLPFVPYLRLAILRWGGFPGLDGRGQKFEPLSTLVTGLEPF